MAAATTATLPTSESATGSGRYAPTEDRSDPFVEHSDPVGHGYPHRYSTNFDPESITLAASASPSQVKRSLEAHLVETERRLQDAQKLGESLLQQQSELTEKLQEVEQQQGDAEISPELLQRLAELEREHNDVGKEIARALLGPKSRVVSGEQSQPAEPSTFSSQATASPTKVSAPTRRQRNQPSSRAGDLQFAADISTSLLAQVRQLQGAVAERDELIKQANAERERMEQENAHISQRLRTLDESEQRYKDENWNLETQNHELLAEARDAADREKRLNANLAAALAEKGRAQNEVDEIRLAHEKLVEEHTTAKKAHDSELHSLKRTVDTAEAERLSLHSKVDELTAQNQELAHAVAARLRNQHAELEPGAGGETDEELKDLSTPEHSPPPSPTKATPRHGGLESETLRSSLHHAHRMIQNLKNNIHREKTEKIELKRMLQDARDELEQRRTEGSIGSGSKRQKMRPDTFKKPARLDMLGGSRRIRTDVELVDDDDWEDHGAESPTQLPGSRHLQVPNQPVEGRLTDTSDAYQTANETEGAFETADERHATESEDFQTGAESLAGDSTDDLTETEDTGSRAQLGGTTRPTPRISLASKPAGDRSSFMSTASTSTGEEDEEEVRTPVVAVYPHKFRLKNGRQSLARQSRVPTQGTPGNDHAPTSLQDSPTTVINERSPPAAEQSLYAELGGLEYASSDRFDTPGRASLPSMTSTPHATFTPGQRADTEDLPLDTTRHAMVESGTMTDPWLPGPASRALAQDAGVGTSEEFRPSDERVQSPTPSDFPLPPSVPVSPLNRADNGTQYTPQKSIDETSPTRHTLAFITPPKMIWDEAPDSEAGSEGVPSASAVQTPQRHLDYSALLAQDTTPVSPERSVWTPAALAFSPIQAQETRPKPVSETPWATKDTGSGPSRPQTAENVTVAAAAATTGLFASAAAAVVGLSTSQDASTPVIAEDETSEAEGRRRQEEPDQKDLPLKDVSGNATSRRAVLSKAETDLENAVPVNYSSNDQASQTLLTADQIDQALKPKAGLSVPVLPVPAVEPTSARSRTTLTDADHAPSGSGSQDAAPGPEAPPATLAPSPMKRPASASSQRPSNLAGQHPPLPSGHMTTIAKAGGRVVMAPTREFSNSSHVATIMGPPALPASAMRRPRTPVESSIRSSARDSAAQRAAVASRYQRGTVTPQLSHRSSVSSFASELDERFNIQSGAQGLETSSTTGTDPRMIQAITQTMIGEFLWKYTRKPGRAEMSDTRHRRYFWVHPYTKTLYWSDQDPQTAGSHELRAKSVAIESVRVLKDNNPLPPGLHRKSLEVITPGRRVRFTASTGQRHETWFNALSYLLLRGEDGHPAGGYVPDGHEMTHEDVGEFNVNGSGYGARLVPTDRRISMSSYNSRTTQGTNRGTATNRQSANSTATRVPPQDTVAGRPAAPSTVRRSRAEQPRETDKDRRPLRAGSMSRFSRMLGSVAGRNTHARPPSGARSEGGSIYDASVVSEGHRDSAEELRKEMLKQEQQGLGSGLENVRACCDGTCELATPNVLLIESFAGKHDVSTLSHSSRHVSGIRHLPRDVSLNMSLRGTVRRSGVGAAGS